MPARRRSFFERHKWETPFEKCLKDLGATVMAGCRPEGVPTTKGKDPPGVSLTGLSHRRVETKLLSLTLLSLLSIAPWNVQTKRLAIQA